MDDIKCLIAYLLYKKIEYISIAIAIYLCKLREMSLNTVKAMSIYSK